MSRRDLTEPPRPAPPHGTDNGNGGWRLLPVIILRYAGYPFADVERFARPDLAEAASRVLGWWQQQATESATRLIRALRAHAHPLTRSLSSIAGMLRPVPEEMVREIAPSLSDTARDALAAYQDAIGSMDASLGELLTRYEREVLVASTDLRAAFADPWMRQMVLMSNDAVFSVFAEWQAGDGRVSAGRTRKMTGLLTMYLQRITTKNDTNAHFGPFAIGRVDPGTEGIRWRQRPSLERRAFLAHWAATILARSLIGDTDDGVIPRMAPLAFVVDGRALVFQFASAKGMPFPWQLRLESAHELAIAELQLLELIDGSRTVADIAALTLHDDRPRVHEMLAALRDAGVLTLDIELPAGEPDTPGSLERELRRLGRPADAAVEWRSELSAFAAADPARRVAILDGLKKRFTRQTAVAPTRNSGRHYADRSIVFEDATGPVEDLTIGTQVKDFIVSELSVIYDALLVGPRIRITREREMLRDWVTRRFGKNVAVPLGEVYRQFAADQAGIALECDRVDQAVADAGRQLADGLLAGHDPLTDIITVEPDKVRELVNRFPRRHGAVCNPDVMIGARDADALAAGEFYGVIGDCHILRDLISHGSFAPFLDAVSADVARDVTDAYQATLEPGEVLVEIVRRHQSKTSTQLDLPIPHLEVSGLSPKPRDQVIQPRELYVQADDEQISLRSHRVGGNIRLMAAISGSPSIRHDPTAAFAYPRSLGGGLFDEMACSYLPRIQSGRAVLCRRRWSVPAERLRVLDLRRKWLSDDMRYFLSATALREEFGFPRHTFAKLSHEPKPVYLDWTSPLLVRQFARLTRGMSPDAHVEISEMLPGPEDLWLDVDGKRRTCEIRCAVVTGGGP